MIYFEIYAAFWIASAGVFIIIWLFDESEARK